MSALTPIPWDTLARYRLIEILALWEGRVAASQIGEAFGIGRQQAQKVLRRYRELAPQNLHYDNQRHGYRPSDDFLPLYTQGRVDEYLRLLNIHDSLDSPFAGLGMGAANTESLPTPNRAITPEVVRELVRASREKRRLEVTYASFTSPQGDERIMVPHTLVFAAGRWHVRAYCEKHREYRDFVLSRFRGVPEDVGPMLGKHDAEHDDRWQTRVAVRLIPDRRLPETERELLAMDFGMPEGELELHCRGPLARYALRELGINPHHAEANPRAQQIEIANRSSLASWILWS